MLYEYEDGPKPPHYDDPNIINMENYGKPPKKFNNFDKSTYYGVVRFQRKHRLTVDGLVGPQTLSKIYSVQKRPSVSVEQRPYPGVVLKRGSRGPDVRWVQQHIGVKQIDGVLGRRSEAAIKAFQKRRKLKSDGRVGPVTWSHLHNS